MANMNRFSACSFCYTMAALRKQEAKQHDRKENTKKIGNTRKKRERKKMKYFFKGGGMGADGPVL